MTEYYKRNISLMDKRIFSRESLDKPIDNPDKYNSVTLPPVEQSDEEIDDYVASDLKRMSKT